MSFAPLLRRSASLAAAWVLASSSPLFGYNQVGSVFTTDGSQADVAAAVGVAPAGSIVNIPAGSFTWGAGGSILYLPNAITLQGAGPGNTIINLSPSSPVGVTGTIQLFAPAVVKGFTINAASEATAFSTQASGWRISNITYVPNGDTDYFCFISQGYGLIDSCNITGGGGSDELIFATGPVDSWQTPDSLGGPNNVFIEDCIFNGPGYVCDANANARVVVRFCTINGQMKIDAHGFASNTPRGVREIEIYGNTWTYNQGGAFSEMELRGGTGMVFNNASNIGDPNKELAWYQLTDYGYQAEWPNFGESNVSAVVGIAPNTAIITTATPHGLQSGWGPIQVSVPNSTPPIAGTYTVTVLGSNSFSIPMTLTAGGTGGFTTEEQTPVNYPINDQIGVGQDPKVGGAAPLYSWNNLQNGTPWLRNLKVVDGTAVTLYQSQTHNPAATFGEADMIKTDRDVFMDLTVSGAFNGSTGVGAGTFAQMNALTPTTKGVGFWVTDQGVWNTLQGGKNGQLYVWNGSAWVLKYTPYTYPNPLRGPVPPTNLTISSP